MTRARRSSPTEDTRPLYARALRLRHVAPSGLLCFVFLEGAVALGILLALAELVSWWGVVVLPVLVALMVKLNDVIAGSLSRAAQPSRPRPAGGFAGGAAAGRGFPGGLSGTGAASVAGWDDEDDRQVYHDDAHAGGEGAVTGWTDRAHGLPDDATTRLPRVFDQQDGTPAVRPWAERTEAQQQWLRQSATRRYE